jgi:hypothetical protein
MPADCNPRIDAVQTLRGTGQREAGSVP